MTCVLYVSATGGISGAERSLLAMLDAGSIDRRALVAAPDGPLLAEVAKRGAATCALPLAAVTRPRTLVDAWRMWWALRAGRAQLRKLVARERPDIVHANTTAAMLYAGGLPTPTIWQVRDLVALGPVGQGLYRRASRVVAISQTVREDVLQYADDGGAKIRLIAPAADTTCFRPGPRAAARAALGLPDAVPIIGLVAQLVPWKRHGLLLDALERLNDRRCLLVLAGADFGRDDAYVASLRARTDVAPLRGRVRWLPWQGAPETVYQALDILALTSTREPFGRAVIEAMACGIPVVAVDEGGPRETVAHGGTGVLAPAEPDALAAALASLLGDPDRRARMGAAGRARAIACYGLEAHHRALSDLYTEAAAPT